MLKLSVVIITLNEERNIGRCIESVLDIADEIVVVDSFSTDKTEEICCNYEVKFIKHAFEGYIEQKNFALQQSLYPNVLSIDADEALSVELQESILKVKQNNEFDGYIVKRLTNYCGKWIKHCGWYPDRKLRLIDKRKGHWEGINPHDMLVLEKDCKISQLRGNMYHYSYYTISDHLRQLDKFTEISSKELFNRGKKATFIKQYLSPVHKFLQSYFFRLGILDGYYGFIVCSISAFATFIKYTKLRSLYKK